MAIFDQNTFIALERDISDIGKANNEKVIVKPRIGASYKSLPLIAQEAEQKASQAIEKVIEHGMVRGFVTEALLKAWKPNFDGARAKADDTKKIWRWELTSAAGATQITGNWVDTGLSELDQAKLYTDSNPMFQALHLTVDMNLDDVLTDGHYSAKATEASVERNYPVAEAGHLEVGRIGAASRYQRYTTLSGKIFVRTKSTNWGDWKIQGMDLTHPKISSSVLPANTDLNNITTHGTYSFVTTNALIELNFPFKDNGTLVVERAGNASLTQIVMALRHVARLLQLDLRRSGRCSPIDWGGQHLRGRLHFHVGSRRGRFALRHRPWCLGGGDSANWLRGLELCLHGQAHPDKPKDGRQRVYAGRQGSCVPLGVLRGVFVLAATQLRDNASDLRGRRACH